MEAGVSMAQRSWDKVGRKSHLKMLPGQGQVAWGGRTNFLDGRQDAEPWGGGQGWRPWCCWGRGVSPCHGPGPLTKPKQSMASGVRAGWGSTEGCGSPGWVKTVVSVVSWLGRVGRRQQSCLVSNAQAQGLQGWEGSWSREGMDGGGRCSACG